MYSVSLRMLFTRFPDQVVQVVSSYLHKRTPQVVMVPPTWPGQNHIIIDAAVVAVLSELDGVIYALKEERSGFGNSFVWHRSASSLTKGR